MRNEIKSMIAHCGLPSLFITINPSDIHHLIFLLLAGKEIDIDTIANFLPNTDVLPSQRERAMMLNGWLGLGEGKGAE